MSLLTRGNKSARSKQAEQKTRRSSGFTLGLRQMCFVGQAVPGKERWEVPCLNRQPAQGPEPRTKRKIERWSYSSLSSSPALLKVDIVVSALYNWCFALPRAPLSPLPPLGLIGHGIPTSPLPRPTIPRASCHYLLKFLLPRNQVSHRTCSEGAYRKTKP